MTAIASQGPVVVDGRARPLLIAALLPLMYAFFGMSWLGVAAVIPEVTTSLDVQRADGVLLITVISMAKSIVPILAGIIAARIGLTTTMRIGGALILAGALMPWLHTYGAAVAVRFVFGVGGAVWVTLMGPVVLAVLTPSQRPIGNALNGVAVNAGIVVAQAITLPLAHAIGFQWALSLYSIGSGVVLVGLSFAGSLDVASSTSAQKIGATLAAYGRTLAQPTTWILAVAFCGPLALYLVLNTFLAQHLESFGIARQAAMQWLSWLNLWGVPASLLSGVLLAKVWKDPRPYLVVAALVVPCALYGALHAESDGARALLFALVGFGMFLPVSPLVTTVQKSQSPASLGMIFGTMFAVTYVVSAAVPSAVGPLVARGVPLSTALAVAGLLGLSPLAGLALQHRDS